MNFFKIHDPLASHDSKTEVVAGSQHRGCFKVDGNGGFSKTPVYTDDEMTNDVRVRA